MLLSLHIFQVSLAKFALMNWSIPLESTVLGFVRSVRFLPFEQNLMNHLNTALSPSTSTSFIQQIYVWSPTRRYVSFEPIQRKFQDKTTLHIRLYDFEIPHGVKQCQTCQFSDF